MSPASACLELYWRKNVSQVATAREVAPRRVVDEPQCDEQRRYEDHEG